MRVIQQLNSRIRSYPCDSFPLGSQHASINLKIWSGSNICGNKSLPGKHSKKDIIPCAFSVRGRTLKVSGVYALICIGLFLDQRKIVGGIKCLLCQFMNLTLNNFITDSQSSRYFLFCVKSNKCQEYGFISGLVQLFIQVSDFWFCRMSGRT